LSIVIDASVTLAWIFADERNELAQAVMAEVVQAGAAVPTIWPLEVANVLLLGVRRGRLTAAQRDASLADLAQLDIEVDGETTVHAWSETLALGERFGLTVYDAAYLELARRRDMPIATLDRALATAADALGIARP
jgi:predicted nucleic acid-binding protein